MVFCYVGHGRRKNGQEHMVLKEGKLISMEEIEDVFARYRLVTRHQFGIFNACRDDPSRDDPSGDHPKEEKIDGIERLHASGNALNNFTHPNY